MPSAAQRAEILAKLDIRAIYEQELGLKIIGSPSATNWVPCYSPFKPADKQKSPSCGLCLGNADIQPGLLVLHNGTATPGDDGKPRPWLTFFDACRELHPQLSGKHHGEICAYWAEKVGIKIYTKPPPTRAQVAGYVSALTEPIRDLLHKKRGLTDESITKYQIGFDTKRERIAYPVLDASGTISNIRFHASKPDQEPKTLNLAGYGEQRLWGADRLIMAPAGSQVCITEGEFDAMLLEQVTGLVATSPTSGTNFDHDWVKLFANKDVILVRDCDAEGRASVATTILPAFRDAVRAGWVQSVRVLWLYEHDDRKDLKDFTDWVTKSSGTKESFFKILAEVQPHVFHGTTEDLPTVDIDTTSLPEMTALTWSALVAKNAPPFLFNYAQGTGRMTYNKDGSPVIRPLRTAEVRFHAAESINFTKRRQVKNKVESLPVPPPVYLAENILADPCPPLPPLTRIIEAPIYSASGILHTQPGYDQATAFFYHPGRDPISIPEIPKRPSFSEKERSRDLLYELICDFPFTSDGERANAVSLMILLFVRPMVSGPTPLYLFEAPAPGSGKTNLLNACAWPAIGRYTPAMSEGRDDDEWRKRISSILLSPPPLVCIDNIRRHIDSSALAAVLTSTVWEDRLLGSSRRVTLPNSCVWAATGNNPLVSNEIARRTIRIRIDPRTDRPWKRDANCFKHPRLFDWASENRARLITAILTMAQAWMVEGCPQGRETLGGFEAWSRVMGGILDVNGVNGFLTNLEDFYNVSDLEGTILRTFVECWWETYRDDEIGSAELYRMVLDKDLPFPLGKGTSERSQKTALGMQLSNMRDRQFGRFRVSRVGTYKRATQWKLEPDLAVITPKCAPEQDGLGKATGEPGEPIPACSTNQRTQLTIL